MCEGRQGGGAPSYTSACTQGSQDFNAWYTEQLVPFNSFHPMICFNEPNCGAIFYITNMLFCFIGFIGLDWPSIFTGNAQLYGFSI